VQGSGGAKGLKRGESEAIIVHNNLPPQPTPFMGQELAELAALKSEGNDHLITIAAPSQRGAVFSLLDHIIRGQLIGREDELSQLEGFWNRAERGEGHLVLLSGEPGIGKTRLVEELSALAQLRGALVLEGHFHPELGVTYLGFREALQDYLRSISLESPQHAKCLATLAICLLQEGLLEQAQAQAETAIELAERLQYSEGIASGCGALCNVFEARGDLASYAQTSERQVAALDQSGDLYGIYDAYFHMINLGNQRGDYAQVERYALEGMELCQKFNAPGWEGPILAGYMFALNYAGRWEEALDHGKRVLPLFERVGCNSCFMFIFWNLADLEAKRGRQQQSQQYFKSAMGIKSQLMLDPATDMRWNLFEHVLRQEWEPAWAVVEKYRAAGYPLFGVTSSSMEMWSFAVPEVAARVGQVEEAKSLAADSMTLFQAVGMPYGVVTSRLALGLAYVGQMKWDEALTEFEQVLEIARTLDHPWDIAVTLYEMGISHTKRRDEGDQERAQQEFEEAFRIFTELKAQPSMEKVNAALDRLK
jgi:tetratricopeptide (TPR) repeat protein